MAGQSTGAPAGIMMEEHDKRKYIFGLRFDGFLLEEAVHRAREMAASDGYHYCVGTNAYLLGKARNDAEYREAVNNADMSLADGCGVIFASRILKSPVRQRVPCIDLVSGLLPELGSSRVYILGGKEGVAEKAGDRLKKNYPGLVICGTHHGYFKDQAGMARIIRPCKPDVVLVCLGSPKQEIWMERYGQLTGARLAIGCGGWIDIAAGSLKRAPKAWQKLNMEWAWRLLQEPWRTGRVLHSLVIPLIAFKEMLTPAKKKEDASYGKEKK